MPATHQPGSSRRAATGHSSRFVRQNKRTQKIREQHLDENRGSSDILQINSRRRPICLSPRRRRTTFATTRRNFPRYLNRFIKRAPCWPAAPALRYVGSVGSLLGVFPYNWQRKTFMDRLFWWKESTKQGPQLQGVMRLKPVHKGGV